MNILTKPNTISTGKSVQADKKNSQAVAGSGAAHGPNGVMAAERINAFVRQVSTTSMLEVDALIDRLRILSERLRTDHDHIERHLGEYATFCQSVMQLTKISSDSMAQVDKNEGPDS